MSNANRCAWSCLAAILLLCLPGCATRQVQPQAQSASVTQPAPAPAPSPPVTGGTNDPIVQAAALPSSSFAGEGWENLFDGHDLAGWKQTQFAGRAEVECRSGLMVLNMGDPFTGVNWTNPFPTMNYEVALDAMRVEGADFFCGLTVPVGKAFCSLIVGGWGGSLLGISSLDGMDASENETTKFMNFENGRWYRIRLRVTHDRLEAWVDAKKMVDVVTTGKEISLRPGDIELSKPFGLASWQTTAALRNIRLRRVDGPADPPPKRRF